MPEKDKLYSQPNHTRKESTHYQTPKNYTQLMTNCINKRNKLGITHLTGNKIALLNYNPQSK